MHRTKQLKSDAADVQRTKQLNRSKLADLESKQQFMQLREAQLVDKNKTLQTEKQALAQSQMELRHATRRSATGSARRAAHAGGRSTCVGSRSDSSGGSVLAQERTEMQAQRKVIERQRV